MGGRASAVAALQAGVHFGDRGMGYFRIALIRAQERASRIRWPPITFWLRGAGALAELGARPIRGPGSQQYRALLFLVSRSREPLACCGRATAATRPQRPVPSSMLRLVGPRQSAPNLDGLVIARVAA